VAVLDRTKEPGSLGEPLYEDFRTALGEVMADGKTAIKNYPVVVGGRYGLGSAEFNPAMVKGVFDELKKDKPMNHFVVGIIDDVTGNYIDYDASFSTESADVYRAMFYGLGSDGTVGANKNSIKIIAEETNNFAQGYFVYDSKKAGAITVSHLRFGKDKIRKPYLITQSNFLGCHNFSFVDKYDLLGNLEDGGIFLLNAPYSTAEVWSQLPGRMQKQIIDKKIKFYAIDAIAIAEKLGLGSRINIIMQTAFFKISGVMDDQKAIDAIKYAIKKTYGNKGDKIVEMNIAAVDNALEHITQISVPASPSNPIEGLKAVRENAPEFVQNVTARIMKQEGASIKVSEMPDDGVWPTGTTQYEKRNIAVSIPVWNPDTCIQCGRCSLVCPHATIRAKAYEAKHLEGAPATFKSTDAKGKELAGLKYTIQIAPEDCTGCGNCVFSCPAKDKGAISMHPQSPLREQEALNYEFFQTKIPYTDPTLYNQATVKGTQFLRQMFEYSGACAGCGETAYIRLVTGLFGDHAMIANATGCSSIYGGNLPTTPYTKRADGVGPSWNNSLFEDNAELAYGMRMTVDKFNERARELIDATCAGNCIGDNLKNLLKQIKSEEPNQRGPIAIEEQRSRVNAAKAELKNCDCEECKELTSLIDYMIRKSVWAFGGDGWAYDIGYGGLDHVLASGKNINIMVMDTEVYSNTGGQSSKATPLGAVAKFAASGKPVGKKDLGMIAMSYGYIYVAKVAMGSNPNQVVKAMIEAEAYDGPSLVICYAHCIAHGIDMTTGLDEQRKAVDSGHWQLYRYNPQLTAEGKVPLQLDSKEPTMPLSEYAYGENRYRILQKAKPELSAKLLSEAQAQAKAKYELLKLLAGSNS
jgi:pyruvate-ferredoxin/flavodoxin oxidoreductase